MTDRTTDDAIPTPIPSAPLTGPFVGQLADGTRPVPQLRRSRGRIALVVALTAAAIALAVSVAMYARAARREAYEAAFPVLAEGSDADTLVREATRWQHAEPALLRALGGFHAPSLAALVGAGACPFTAAGTTFAAGPGLAAEVRAYVDDTLAQAARGRFATEAARDEILARLAGPVTVTAGDVAYAFDPGAGLLACAGRGQLRSVE